jgi:hypothetical protein
MGSLFWIEKATTANEDSVAVVVLRVLTDFKSFNRFYVAKMSEKSMFYTVYHPHLQEESSPFTGKNIPIYRRNHPRLQERTEENIPFVGCCDNTLISKILKRHCSSCKRAIIPVYRRIVSICSRWLY